MAILARLLYSTGVVAKCHSWCRYWYNFLPVCMETGMLRQPLVLKSTKDLSTIVTIQLLGMRTRGFYGRQVRLQQQVYVQNITHRYRYRSGEKILLVRFFFETMENDTGQIICDIYSTLILIIRPTPSLISSCMLYPINLHTGCFALCLPIMCGPFTGKQAENSLIYRSTCRRSSQNVSNPITFSYFILCLTNVSLGHWPCTTVGPKL